MCRSTSRLMPNRSHRPGINSSKLRVHTAVAMHDIKYKEVYMDNVITGFQDDFASVMLSKASRPAKKPP